MCLQQYWQRVDGTQTTREHMLMALAKLDYILIKATYTVSTAESSLSDISMDIAESRSTGLDRAYTVEQCNCPQGYRGHSCEVRTHLHCCITCFFEYMTTGIDYIQYQVFVLKIRPAMMFFSLWYHSTAVGQNKYCDTESFRLLILSNKRLFKALKQN